LEHALDDGERLADGRIPDASRREIGTETRDHLGLSLRSVIPPIRGSA
jgi:hypothetical protein